MKEFIHNLAFTLPLSALATVPINFIVYVLAAMTSYPDSEMVKTINNLQMAYAIPLMLGIISLLIFSISRYIKNTTFKFTLEIISGGLGLVGLLIALYSIVSVAMFIFFK